MFTDSRGSAEHKGFKTHGPHFFPWLRSSLKSHQNHDGNINGAVKPVSENRNHLKGKGFFSIQGKDKEKKGCNGVARMLPVVLRGHHILTGKQREESPARWTQSPELDPEVSVPPELDGSLGQENHIEVKCSPQNVAPSQNDQVCTTLRRYGPLVVAPPTPTVESKCTPPVMVCVDNKEKVWDYSSRNFRQRDLHSASWVGPDTQSILNRHPFTSSFSFIHQQRNSQSHRDLSSLRDSHLDRALNGVLFSTQVANRGPGCTKTLRGPRRPRPSSERITNLEQAWFQPDRTGVGAGDGKRKAVRNQIKRVVDNLERVLGALQDVQQEMKEVVRQIDFLTSSIDLNEDEQSEPQVQSSSNSSSSSALTVGSVIHRPSAASQNGVVWRDNQSASGSQSPPDVLLLPVNSENNTLRFGSRKGAARNPFEKTERLIQAVVSPISPLKTLPVRPPTPGLSPLTVSLQHPNSPVSQPESPSSAPSSAISPQTPSYIKPPPFSSSTLKPGSHQIHQSSHTPGTSSLTSNVGSPPEFGRERRAVPVRPLPGPSHATLSVKPKAGQQSRRGRKPPPYPHHRLSEPPKPTAPRKAPPYPEKRKLQSTTV